MTRDPTKRPDVEGLRPKAMEYRSDHDGGVIWRRSWPAAVVELCDYVLALERPSPKPTVELPEGWEWDERDTPDWHARGPGGNCYMERDYVFADAIPLDVVLAVLHRAGVPGPTVGEGERMLAYIVEWLPESLIEDEDGAPYPEAFLRDVAQALHGEGKLPWAGASNAAPVPLSGEDVLAWLDEAAARYPEFRQAQQYARSKFPAEPSDPPCEPVERLSALLRDAGAELRRESLGESGEGAGDRKASESAQSVSRVGGSAHSGANAEDNRAATASPGEPAFAAPPGTPAAPADPPRPIEFGRLDPGVERMLDGPPIPESKPPGPADVETDDARAAETYAEALPVVDVVSKGPVYTTTLNRTDVRDAFLAGATHAEARHREDVGRLEVQLAERARWCTDDPDGCVALAGEVDVLKASTKQFRSEAGALRKALAQARREWTPTQGPTPAWRDVYATLLPKDTP